MKTVPFLSVKKVYTPCPGHKGVLQRFRSHIDLKTLHLLFFSNDGSSRHFFQILAFF